MVRNTTFLGESATFCTWAGLRPAPTSQVCRCVGAGLRPALTIKNQANVDKCRVVKVLWGGAWGGDKPYIPQQFLDSPRETCYLKRNCPFVCPFVCPKINFMPTVREIASRAGVSKTTVSLVLNNKDGVSDVLRQRVHNALREFDDHTNGKTSNARELQSEGGPLSIALLHSSGMEATQFFRDILQGIQAAVDRYQAQLRLISFASENQDITKHLYFKDDTLRPDGILMVEARFADLAFPQLQKLHVPTAMVGSPSYNLAMPAAIPNEIDEGYRATRYLLEMGHRNIGFVFARLQARYAKERLQGYQQALQEFGVEPLDRWIAVGETDSVARSVLTRSPEITAIMFSNQAAARVGLPVIQAMGYAIPERLSVLVFDETDEAPTYNPPLTTVAYPLHLEGFWAVRMLLDLLREPQMENFQVTFRAKIIERASCAPPLSVESLKS